MANKQPTTPQTVKFNVGGKLFETSRSLVDQHDDTMLARLVSDTWQEDPTKPIFIDRNGDIFAQVLDYLRYGSVVLPDKIVKDMFLRDLDYYGIIAKEGTVKTTSEAWAVHVNTRHVKRKKLEVNMRKLNAEKAQLEKENDIDFLANYCAGRYIYSGGSVSVRISSEDKEPFSDRLWNAALRVVSNEEESKVDFTESLSKFGLGMMEVPKKFNGEITIKMSLL